MDRNLPSCVLGEAKVRALVDLHTWYTALEGTVAGMMSSELAAVHYLDYFDAPWGRIPIS